MNLTSYKLALLPALIAANLALADETLEEETIVTASRQQENLRETLASASLITHADISLTQPKDLSDLLDAEVGLNIVHNGGPGSVTTLSTRGSNSSHTLFLINGMRFNSATTGTTQFQFIDPELLQRVEIVRGSSSTLYGSDAIGGVVQLFTYDNAVDTQTKVSLNGGSHNYRRAALAHKGNKGLFDYSLALSSMASDGIDRLEDDTDNNADEDAYENTNAQLFARYRISEQWTLQAAHLQSDGESHYDSAWVPSSSPYDEQNIRNSQLALNYAAQIYSTALSIGQSRDENINRDDGVNGPLSFFKTERNSLYWQHGLKFNPFAVLTAGLDIYEDQVDTSIAYEDENTQPIDSRQNSAVFVQWQGDAGIIDWKLGTRSDDNEAFGEHNTSSIALGFDIGAAYKLYASWSEGFRAPSFNDLYYPNGFGSSGNPYVLPEESENYEVGLRGFYSQWSWEATAFQNEINNLIAWAPGDDFIWRPSNVASAEIEGVELSSTLALGALELSASAAYTAAIDADSNEDIVGRSRHKYTLELRHQLGNFYYGSQLRHQGRRHTSTESIDAYTLIDFFANYELSTYWSFNVKIDNLFDTDYQQSLGFNEDGRNLRIGAAFTF